MDEKKQDSERKLKVTRNRTRMGNPKRAKRGNGQRKIKKLSL